MRTQESAPQVIVSLGTDHHRFDRLIDWVDYWLENHLNPPTCLVQYGASRAPFQAQGITRMPREEIIALYAAADVVVVQGGPGSILDARGVGVLPIAVPRLPELQEVVDRHQVSFTQIMVEHGEAIMAQTYDQLTGAIEAALRDPASVRTPPRTAEPMAACQKLVEAIENLDRVNSGPLASRRIRQLLVRR